MKSDIEDIQRKYESGALDPIKEDLERFLSAHKDDILRFREREISRGFERMTPDVAVKFFILKFRTVNPKRDIDEQRREIERERWIRGVRTGREPDAHHVALDWAREYSASWRAYRVTSIVFVFEQEKERYLKFLE